MFVVCFSGHLFMPLTRTDLKSLVGGNDSVVRYYIGGQGCISQMFIGEVFKHSDYMYLVFLYDSNFHKELLKGARIVKDDERLPNCNDSYMFNLLKTRK